MNFKAQYMIDMRSMSDVEKHALGYYMEAFKHHTRDSNGKLYNLNATAAQQWIEDARVIGLQVNGTTVKAIHSQAKLDNCERVYTSVTQWLHNHLL
ncbi:hypothetical protein IttPL_0156 [Pseudomonas phage ITTPL]|uniref:Uncharacterized protein n=1 Tax=Pseudomonas phage ITTPL TaxID=2544984 RepID=A0A5B7LVY6_9CAUD|nr:hypothetical protein QE324_gp155 [Pseudomonas phage ITTPL]QBP28170.1 hypothetical protein IttPL_0156 [Pseudomonas phage ITTPL]